MMGSSNLTVVAEVSKLYVVSFNIVQLLLALIVIKHPNQYCTSGDTDYNNWRTLLFKIACRSLKKGVNLFIELNNRGTRIA